MSCVLVGIVQQKKDWYETYYVWCSFCSLDEGGCRVVFAGSGGAEGCTGEESSRYEICLKKKISGRRKLPRWWLIKVVLTVKNMMQEIARVYYGSIFQFYRWQLVEIARGMVKSELGEWLLGLILTLVKTSDRIFGK